jgi:hypothetical protein
MLSDEIEELSEDDKIWKNIWIMTSKIGKLFKIDVMFLTSHYSLNRV